MCKVDLFEIDSLIAIVSPDHVIIPSDDYHLSLRILMVSCQVHAGSVL